MEQDLAADNVAAAVRVAHDLGIEVGQPVVLRDLSTTLLHLTPSPVVARAWRSGRRDPLVVEREIEATTYLATHGARVAAPYDDPGPHRSGDHVVTLWHLVDHDPDRPLDSLAAGRALREIHDLLADAAAPDLADLPHFARLQEASDVIAALDPTPAERDGLEEMLSLATARIGELDLVLQALHGDAWLGNVLRTPDGPLWTDFEFLCRGPREVDLAANQAVARLRGGSSADDDLLEGYGPVDRDLVDALLPVALVPFVAWTFRLAAERPEYLPVARARLDLSLEGLRASSD